MKNCYIFRAEKLKSKRWLGRQTIKNLLFARPIALCICSTSSVRKRTSFPLNLAIRKSVFLYFCLSNNHFLFKKLTFSRHFLNLVWQKQLFSDSIGFFIRWDHVSSGSIGQYCVCLQDWSWLVIIYINSSRNQQ